LPPSQLVRPTETSFATLPSLFKRLNNPSPVANLFALPARVQPKQYRHDYQHQRLHENEEAENKLAVLIE